MDGQLAIFYFLSLSCNKADSKVNLFLAAVVLKLPFSKAIICESYYVNVERNSGFAWF